jgi:hypothetical protein
LLVMPKKVKKAEKRESKSSKNFTSKFLLVSAAILAILFLLFKDRSGVTPTIKSDVIQNTAQLAKPSGELNGFGTVLKTWDGKTYELSATAFVSKPSANKSYYVILKADSEDVADKFLGKMVLSGDVYSLNYSSTESLYSYKKVEIVEASDSEVESGKTGTVILTGQFSK